MSLISSEDTSLREYADRMADAERIVGFGVWKWELSSGRVLWSAQLHRIYGLEPGTFPGTVDAFLERLHPEDRPRVWGHIERTIATGEPFVFEERIRRADGAERVLLSQGRPITDDGGAVVALVGVCHDVTQRAEAERALGASERRVRAIVDNTPSVVTVKDLEGRYLMVNAETSRLLGVTPEEIVSRACSDVFPPHVAERQRANDRRALYEGRPVYDETVLVVDGEPRSFVTVTFALPDADGHPVETCTIATDVTERKERESERRDRRDWERRIRTAIDQRRMVAFAQPIVDVRSRETTSCELLARMRIGEAVLAPAQFLPASERYGLVQAIDVWMVEQALELGANAEVNLSAVTLDDASARNAIVEALERAPAAARHVVFEITETATLERLDAAHEFAHAVTALGAGIALDDFGTGFGSFTYLRALPLRHLKIDVSFVRNLPRRPDDRRMVGSIVQIAQQFGLQTVAEGVEDERTLELLREMGVDFAQGFHLGRPVPLGDYCGG